MSSTFYDLYGNEDESAMYNHAIQVPLNEKIEMSIQTILTFQKQALNLSDLGYYVAFSGGKDSIVMDKLFQMSGVKYQLHYHNVTIDPPELIQFIKKYYPHAVWSKSKKNLPMKMVDVGMPPTRKIRWCCLEYKEGNGTERFVSIGVRATESARRKGLWKTVQLNKHSSTMIMCPILYWTDKDVWEFIRQNNMPYCCLYDEGFKRIGCIGCPMSGKHRVTDFQRYPKYKAMWERAFVALHKRLKGVPTKTGKPRLIDRYNTPQDHFKWWMEDTNVNDTDEPDCQLFLW